MKSAIPHPFKGEFFKSEEGGRERERGRMNGWRVKERERERDGVYVCKKHFSMYTHTRIHTQRAAFAH